MGKADALIRDLEDNLNESIGKRAGSTDQNPIPQVYLAPDPLDDLRHLNGSGTLPTDSIRPDPEQPRQQPDPEADLQLAESIRSQGLLQPIRVRLDAGIWYIVVGERRWRAALAAGLQRVPVVHVQCDLSPAAILEEQLTENLQRAALKPIDEANAYRRYLDLTGKTAKQLAEILAVDPGTVSRRLSILNLDETIQERISTGELSPKSAAEIAKLEDHEQQLKVAEEAIKEDLSADEVAKRVKQRRGKAAPKRSPKPTKQPASAALTTQWIHKLEEKLHVVIWADHPITAEDAVFTLERTLKELRAEHWLEELHDVTDESE